jgi:hypothetical protein
MDWGKLSRISLGIGIFFLGVALYSTITFRHRCPTITEEWCNITGSNLWYGVYSKWAIVSNGTRYLCSTQLCSYNTTMYPEINCSLVNSTNCSGVVDNFCFIPCLNPGELNLIIIFWILTVFFSSLAVIFWMLNRRAIQRYYQIS